MSKNDYIYIYKTIKKLDLFSTLYAIIILRPQKFIILTLINGIKIFLLSSLTLPSAPSLYLYQPISKDYKLLQTNQPYVGLGN